MAVFTRITDEEIANLLAWLPEGGRLLAAQGVASGVENTTYLLDTDKGRRILTVFENRRGDDDPVLMARYMAHLKGKGLPCPEFLASVDGCVMFTLAGKQAGVQTFLHGRAVPLDALTQDQCRAVGRLLAEMHLAGQDFDCPRLNPVGLATWNAIARKVQDAATPEDIQLIAQVFEAISPVFAQDYPVKLPHGAVHADVFPDNVFFEGDAVSGVIDFGFVCNETWLYDLMVTLHAFAFDGEGRRRDALADALMQGYESGRTLTKGEVDVLPLVGQAAALRIFLTRLHDWLFPAKGAEVTAKDPRPYARIVESYRTA